jgi:hypothetical protein
VPPPTRALQGRRAIDGAAGSIWRGEYRVVYDAAENPSMLDVSSMDGRHQAIALTDPVNVRRGTPSSNRLVFERSGGTYVLSEVFAKGSSEGLEVLGTHHRG